MPSGSRPQPPVGTVRVAISGTFASEPWTNVVYLKFTDDGTQTAADLKSIIDALGTSWNTRLASSFNTGLVFTDLKATWITGIGTALEYEASVVHAGTNSGTATTAQVCAVANWAINQYYRGGHPRSYLTGINLSNTSGGNQLTSAFQASLATALTSWMNDINALTGTHVSVVALGTVSYQRGNSWRVPPVFYAYKSCSVRNFLGTQRRRVGGR